MLHGNLDRGRWNLWRLTAYYQIKEPGGSPGKVHLNLALCSNSNIRPSQDRPEWLPAYQVDVGQPVGQTTVFTEGNAGIATTMVASVITKFMGVTTRMRLYWCAQGFLGLHRLWRWHRRHYHAAKGNASLSR